jgi:hypothetical protein
MGRRWWVFSRDGMSGWLATPRDDIEPAELAVERAKMAAHRAVRSGTALPSQRLGGQPKISGRA